MHLVHLKKLEMKKNDIINITAIKKMKCPLTLIDLQENLIRNLDALTEQQSWQLETIYL